MDVDLTVSILTDRVDGRDLTDEDILALRREVQRLISIAWANGDFNLDELILDDPMVYSEFD